MPIFHNDRDDIEAQLATDIPLAMTAYEIRYEGYRVRDFIEERVNGQFSDEYDRRRNSLTVVVFRAGVPVGTIRSLVLDLNRSDPVYHDLPVMTVFGTEVCEMMATLGKSGRMATAIEINRVAVRKEAERDVDVLFALYRAAGYIALAHDTDVVLNAVRPHHMPFYRRLGFRKIEDARPYPGLKFETGLMACPRSQYAHSFEEIPFLSGMSAADPMCQALLAGHRVPIFAPNQPAPTPDPDHGGDDPTPGMG